MNSISVAIYAKKAFPNMGNFHRPKDANYAFLSWDELQRYRDHFDFYLWTHGLHKYRLSSNDCNHRAIEFVRYIRRKRKRTERGTAICTLTSKDHEVLGWWKDEKELFAVECANKQLKILESFNALEMERL